MTKAFHLAVLIAKNKPKFMRKDIVEFNLMQYMSLKLSNLL